MPQGFITQQFAEGKRKDPRLQPGAGIKAIWGLWGLTVPRALAFSAEKFPQQLSQRGRDFSIGLAMPMETSAAIL